MQATVARPVLDELGRNKYCIDAIGTTARYLTFDNFECRHATEQGVTFQTSGGKTIPGITVENFYIHNAKAGAFNSNSPIVGRDDGLYANQLDFEDCGEGPDSVHFINNVVRWSGGHIPGAAGVGEVERLARRAPAGGTDRRFRRHRKLTAAKRLRGARRIRIPSGIEGIAAALAWHRRRLLHDRRGWGDLRLDIATLAALRLRRIAGLGLRLAVARLKLHWRCRGDARLGGRRRTGPGLHAALQLPQPILELAIAILQFLVLAGELAKLLF